MRSFERIKILILHYHKYEPGKYIWKTKVMIFPKLGNQNLNG